MPTTARDTESGSVHGHTVASEGPPPAPRVDLEALGAHYERSYTRLYVHAVSIVGSTELAHDIVQEAFAETTAKIKQGVEIRSLNAWMKTVVRNLAIDVLARKGREQRAVSLLADRPERVGPLSPVEIAHLRERCGAVYRQIERLEPTQRSAFLLAELRGLSYAEIADSLHRSENAVAHLLSRARQRIRAAVGPDAASVVTPIANLEIARRLPALKGQARGLRDHILAKIADLQTSMASLFQRSADLVAQPATSLATAALVVATLGAPSAGPMTPPVPAAAGPPAVAALPVPHEPDRSAGGTRPAAPRAVDKPTAGEPPATSLLPAAGEKPRPATDTGGTPSDDKRPKPGPADERPADAEIAVAPMTGTPASGGQPGETEPLPPPPPPGDDCADAGGACSEVEPKGGAFGAFGGQHQTVPTPGPVYLSRPAGPAPAPVPAPAPREPAAGPPLLVTAP